jgi:hypothetical protein
VLWAGAVLWMVRLEPPVEPLEFGAMCQCGHSFAAHRTQTGVEGSPCFAQAGGDGLCGCSAFEPEDRPTEPMTLAKPRALDVPAGFDVIHDPRTDRLALVPECRCSQYAVEPEGGPLKCVACGEELCE